MSKRHTGRGGRDKGTGGAPAPRDGTMAVRGSLRDRLRQYPAIRSRSRSVYYALRRVPRAVVWRWLERRFIRGLRTSSAPWGNTTATPGRDAVVFSSYVPTEEALHVAVEFLDVFKREFADCDFFVGINTGSLPAWELAVRESGLRVRVGNVAPMLTVDSDASGFQRALHLMEEERREYRLVWFGHTKGATNNDPELRRTLIRDFYLQRRWITCLFDQPRVGSFGHHLTLNLNGAAPGDDSAMDALYPFPFTRIGTHYLHTFYVHRGSIVKTFLEGCTGNFFTKNLVSELGFSRYFFEGDFSRLADRFGYYPLYRERLTLPTSTDPVTRTLVRAAYEDWERQLPEPMRAGVYFP